MRSETAEGVPNWIVMKRAFLSLQGIPEVELRVSCQCKEEKGAPESPASQDDSEALVLVESLIECSARAPGGGRCRGGRMGPALISNQEQLQSITTMFASMRMCMYHPRLEIIPAQNTTTSITVCTSYTEVL